MKKLLNIFLIFSICFVITGCDNTELKRKTTNTLEVKEESSYDYKFSMITFGDALIHPAVYNDAKRNSSTYNFKKMFTEVEKIISDYDLKFYNQETVIGGASLGVSGYPTFNSPDAIGNDLIATGFNVVNLASNHTMDKGSVGATYSANFWKNKEGVYAIGSYTNSTERNNIVIKEMNGITYAILSYAYGTNGLPVPSGKEYLINLYSDAKAKQDIEKIRDKVDVLMVSMHWGTEYVLEPTSEQKREANYLASLGVDVIIGHHPHVLQPVTFIDDTLVIYSLGNMISNQWVLGTEKNIGLTVAFDVEKHVENGKSSVKITNVKADLTWVKSSATSSYASTDFQVIPFTQVTDSMLANHESVYKKYMGIVNKYNNKNIQMGFFK